jgi:hypothetical protein
MGVPMRIVRFVWIDASDETGTEWKPEKHYHADHDDSLITSCGFLIKEDELSVTLAMDYSNGKWRNVGYIPKGWIIDRQEFALD